MFSLFFISDKWLNWPANLKFTLLSRLMSNQIVLSYKSLKRRTFDLMIVWQHFLFSRHRKVKYKKHRCFLHIHHFHVKFELILSSENKIKKYCWLLYSFREKCVRCIYQLYFWHSQIFFYYIFSIKSVKSSNLGIIIKVKKFKNKLLMIKLNGK